MESLPSTIKQLCQWTDSIRRKNDEDSCSDIYTRFQRFFQRLGFTFWSVSFVILTILFFAGARNFHLGNDLSPTQFEVLEKEMLRRAELIYQNNLKGRSHTIPKHECTYNQWTCKFRFRMSVLSPTWPCPSEVHVGAWGEGGKWICNVTRAVPHKTAIVYSVGSNGDPGFERSMFNWFSAKSHTFDPTLNVRKLAKVSNLTFLEFHNVGLTGTEDPEEDLKYFKPGQLAEGAQLMHVDDIMKMLGHEYVDVFKIDCEGCEVNFVKYLEKATTRRKPLFGQVQMETHSLDQNILSGVTQGLEELGYRLFHVEPNFYCKKCWELAYIHESLTKH